MRKKIVFFLFTLFVFGCGENNHPDVSYISKNTSLARFDSAFFNTDTAKSVFYNQLSVLKEEYPHFFMSNETDRFFYLQRTSEMGMDLYAEVKKVFGDMQEQEANLNYCLKHFYHYYGTEKTIKAYTYISNLDFNYPIILADTVLFIASDMYLGAGNPVYSSVAKYQTYYRQPAFLVRDVAEALALAKNAKPKEERLLDDMIFHGKLMYFVSQMLPDANETVVTRYSPKDLAFCVANERNMWSYFIENNLLFDTSLETKRRFINLAPFSKFYTKLDNDSPGMVGKWVGYQIVKAYAEKQEVTLQALMEEYNSDKILKSSGYKP